ncbi:MAG TPA: glycosyl hydrolase [Terriglobia bacterium]|nr:glycosyl hydrolase [Terriglobia bacterium]
MKRHWIAIILIACGVLAWGFGSSRLASAANPSSYDASWLKGMKWRLIGPFRGGRTLAVTGVRGQPEVYYFGSVSGGVWKTADGGERWEPLTDKEPISSIGSIAISYSDPNVIYVGTGEGCPRGNVSYGNGVWKSLDAGKTWVHLGLEDTQTIPKVIVDPDNPSEVFVAALGHVYGPNPERGVYKSSDGGKTWKKTLYKDDKTGAVDIAFDPHNPHVLFAALWEMNRTPYSLSSGGPGSGLYKSSDDGETWKRLEEHGLPKGIWGRVGIAISGADSERIYALVEAAEGGLYRSDDGGENWTRVSADHKLWQRAWYYMHVFADPKSVDTVYVLDVSAYRSTDGGHNFETLHIPHGDNHGLWIDPDNPQRMIAGNDGGAAVSVDGGKTWSPESNQPTAQFYHVIADDRFPYRVYGAQQDNSSVTIVSRSDDGVIDRGDWYPIGGGESCYIAPYPPDPDITYACDYEGAVLRYNHHTRQTQVVSAWPEITDGGGAAHLKYRAQWTFPVLISPHDPNVIYAGMQMILKSTNGGASWTEISPDLTRNDKSKQQISGGPILKDDTGTEYYDTVFSIAESPVQKNLIWAGSDDGLVHLTRDGGRHWTDVTPKGMPEWSLISLIEASPHEAGRAYLAVDRHRLDDHRPYIYKTADFGANWAKITTGMPDGSYVHAVREDPKRRGLLYAGTETGVMISFDDGDHWQPLQLNLPVSPVHDLVVKNDDLVAATHGRSFWVLDDLAPLRELSEEIATQSTYLFKPSLAYRTEIHHRPTMGQPVGENPPTGAVLYYYLKTAPKEKEEVTLEILDGEGRAIRKYSSKKQASALPAEAQEEEEEAGEETNEAVPAEAGLNRFNWDLRYQPATTVNGYSLWDYEGGIEGPAVVPGTYQVRLTANGQTLTAPLEVRLDPRVKASPEDLKKQLDLALEINRRLTRLNTTVNQIRSLHNQIRNLDRELSDNSKDLIAASKDLDKKLSAVEEALINPKIAASEDSVAYAIQLDGKLAALESDVESADAAPTEGARAAYADLDHELDRQLTAWDAIRTHELTAVNDLARREKVQAIVLTAGTATEGRRK